MKQALPTRGQPRKGRPAALAASPSLAKRERGGRREATQGVFHVCPRASTTGMCTVLRATSSEASRVSSTMASMVSR